MIGFNEATSSSTWKVKRPSIYEVTGKLQ